MENTIKILEAVYMVETGHVNIVKRTLRFELGCPRFKSIDTVVVARYRKNEVRLLEEEYDGSSLRVYFKDGDCRLFVV